MKKRIPYQTRWNPIALETVKAAAATPPRQSMQDFIEEAAVSAARRKLDPGTPELTVSKLIQEAAQGFKVTAAEFRKAGDSEAAELYAGDTASLEQIANAAARGDFETARKIAAGLDRFVKEAIPDAAWQILFPGRQS